MKYPCSNIDVATLLTMQLITSCYAMPKICGKNLPKTLCKNSPKTSQKSCISKNLLCLIFCPDNFSDKNFCKPLTKF